MIKSKPFIRTFIFFIVLLLSSNPLFAQGTTKAAINGVVLDQNNNPLPGANVVAVHQPSGTQYGVTTRDNGKFNLLGLRTGGPYKVTVSYVGYTTQEKEDIYLQLGQDLEVDFILPETTVELSGVTVTAERGAIISSARTGAAQNVSTKQIQEVPTISRSFQNFAKLSPLFSGDALQAAGRSNRYNNIQIDGTQYNDLFGLGSSGTPGGQTGTNPISLDAINEFQVVIAPYDVRYSGFTGGGINAITRSGTNRYEGSAYFYGRNESLVGKNPDGSEVAEFKDYQYGFRAGGPIVQDKLFFFVNGEQTQYSFPLNNISLTQGVSNARALANRFVNIMQSQYDFNPGSYDEFEAERPSTKLFARLDYNISENHKLTLRHNYVDSYDDNLNNRNRLNSLSFDSFNYRIKNNTNSTVLQLNSTFSNNMSNELIVGYTRIRDRRAGTSSATSEIEVREPGLTINAGPDRYSSANELDQDIFELTDNFTYILGDHAITLGTHNEFFSFRNLFIRSFYGFYQFNSLDDLEAGDVAFYQRVYSRTSDPEQAAEFDVMQYGFYVQDEWTFSPDLKFTFGLRADIPTFPETPAANPLISENFPGYQTDQIPSGNILWSPRFGFNYDIFGDGKAQLRGGVGMFTGRIPYVWMSNNYGNTGTLYAELRGFGSELPISFDPNNQPQVGDLGTGTPQLRSEVNLVDPDLKMPQVLRYNIGVDRELALGFIGTVEFQYSKTVNDMLYRKINLEPAVGKLGTVGSSTEERVVYGGTNSGGGNFYDILELYNTSGGYQWDLVFQVQRNMARGLSVNAGYRMGRSEDKNSVTSSQARSQMRYNPIDNDPNNPALSTSLYQVDNRIWASVSYVHEFFDNAATTISLFYNGETGAPFSFIYYGDVNNDGFDQNDLFYIPRNSSEILLGRISNGQYVPADDQTYEDLDDFIENNEYLSENRGKVAERNGARNPWRNILDIRIAQDIPDLWGMGQFQITLDILNFLNLLNNEWGWNENVYSTYTIANYQGTVTHNGQANVPVYSFSKPENNEPWSASESTSRWAMQLGIRYTL